MRGKAYFSVVHVWVVVYWVEAFEEDETLPVHLADLNQQQEKEDALQEKVIVEAIRKTIERNDKKDGDVDKLSIDQVEIATVSNKLYEIDELLDESSEEENMQNTEPEKMSGIIQNTKNDKKTTFEQSGNGGYILNDDIVSRDLQRQSNIFVEKQVAADVKVNTIENKESTQDVRALSNYATPSSISAFNSPIRNRSKKERQGFSDQNMNTVDDRLNQRSAIRFKSKQIEFNKIPSIQIHPKLKPLSWLIGKWQDDNEKEGLSIEEWELANYRTLIGSGFKYSTNNDLLFKEQFKIEYRLASKQIFLRVKYIENDRFVDYMLISYDTDQILFKQKEQMDYPDEVIIQRNLDGYSTIITNTNKDLLPDQQRYLENRHRVSNIRAIRTLRTAEQ